MTVKRMLGRASSNHSRCHLLDLLCEKLTEVSSIKARKVASTALICTCLGRNNLTMKSEAVNYSFLVQFHRCTRIFLLADVKAG